jgi:hypothetical protein
MAATLWCPHPNEINPHCDAVVSHTWEWLLASDMLPQEDKRRRLERARVGELAARTNPRVPDQMLALLSDWYMWLFAFDDGYCDDAELGCHPGPLVLTTSRLTRCLDADWTESGSPDPPASALRRLWKRVAAGSSAAQLARWEATVREYLAAQVWEAANREVDAVPPLEEYQVMRRHAGATYTCLALIEVAGGYEIPAPLASSLEVRRFNDVAADLVSWDNDLYSYDKEKLADGARHNLVGVLQHHHRCSLPEAFSYAKSMHDTEMRRFGDMGTALAADSPELRPYIDAVGLWLRGHIAWSSRSSRFAVAP